MDKPVLSNIAAGSHYTASALNERFDALANAIANAVGRAGVAEDNSLQGNLDANTYTIVNLSAPVTANSAARLQDLNDAIEELTNGAINSTPSIQLRSDLASNSVNKGSDLIKVVATTNTVTQELVRIEAAFGAADVALAADIANTDSNLASNVADINANIAAIVTSVVLPGYIGGLGLTWATNTNITVAAGACTDTNNTVTMVGSAMTKNIGATWAAGTPQGGMAAALTATNGTWYHFFAIAKDVAGVWTCDYGFDASLTAANLKADANVIAAGFSDGSTMVYRRLGSVYYQDGTVKIRKFYQLGNSFSWTDPAPHGTAVGAYALAITRDSYTMLVPTAYPTMVRLSLVSKVDTDGTTYYVLLTGSADTDTAPSSTAFNYVLGSGGANEFDSCSYELYTANGTVGVRSSNAKASAFNLVTRGWVDNRGQ